MLLAAMQSHAKYLSHIPRREKEFFASRLKQVWLQPNYQTAVSYAENLMDEYEDKYPAAIQTLEGGLEDSLQFFHFKQVDHRKISSTNMLERLNREIRRRRMSSEFSPTKIHTYVW